MAHEFITDQDIPEFDLVDDGTLDTVLKCSLCGEELRYTPYEEYEGADEWIDWCVDDARDTHICAETLEDVPDNGHSDVDTGC